MNGPKKDCHFSSTFTRNSDTSLPLPTYHPSTITIARNFNILAHLPYSSSLRNLYLQSSMCLPRETHRRGGTNFKRTVPGSSPSPHLKETHYHHHYSHLTQLPLDSSTLELYRLSDLRTDQHLLAVQSRPYAKTRRSSSIFAMVTPSILKEQHSQSRSCSISKQNHLHTNLPLARSLCV